MRKWGVLFEVLCLVGLLTVTADAAPLYTIQDLGVPPDRWGWSQAWGLNDAGQVVGHTGSYGTAVLWDGVNGLQFDLGRGTARGINNAGQVVGYGEGHYNAFLWDAVNGLQMLGQLPGDTFSVADDINERGQVVGRSGPINSTASAHAFLWDERNGMQDLGFLPGTAYAYALGINDNGQVVGCSGGRAFLWDSANGMQDLGGFTAHDINNNGQVIGQGYGGGFIWDSTNGVHSIPAIPFSINDRGQVVGWHYGLSRAFIWESGAGETLLDTLIPEDSGWDYLYEARDINERGQIAGAGYIDGVMHAFLLTPVGDTATVPEPSSFLVFFGLGVITLVRVAAGGTAPLAKYRSYARGRS
jgi:probable HAF family extracellular repeat protein